MTDTIKTPMGEYSRRRLDALPMVRKNVLDAARMHIKSKGYSEVTTSSLVNVAGSCENPHTSFKLNYYGRPAHLSQSAQLQLEALVLRLKRGFFTITTSFREENYNDPEAKGRRLSEFTLIESERPHTENPEDALQSIIREQTHLLTSVVGAVLHTCKEQIDSFGIAPEGGALTDYLGRVTLYYLFPQITYGDALTLLNKTDLTKKRTYRFGDDLGPNEERAILQANNYIPTFVTHQPASLKFFNMKQTPDGSCAYSVDLLAPPLGEIGGGAVREESPEKIARQLCESNLGECLRKNGLDPKQPDTTPFAEYFKALKSESEIGHSGYGIGFERLVAFLLGSNDILHTIADRTLQP